MKCPECGEPMVRKFRKASKHHGFDWTECSSCDYRTPEELDVDEDAIDRAIERRMR